MPRIVAAGEQSTNPLNVARFVVRNPNKIGTLVGKVFNRLVGAKRDTSTPDNTAWILSHSHDEADVAMAIAPDLWHEAVAFGEVLKARGDTIVARIPFEIGGGGDYRFLYWLTRLYRPEIVVETGVAAGWTSQAFLEAMRVNYRGTLYSSDFPYFRVDNPESYIGCVIDPALRGNWNLYLEGDAKALPNIFKKIERVDIFHYDSDKSWAGRDLAIGLVHDKISPDGLILMDDILNNGWFRYYVEKENVPFTIINGRVGVIGRIAAPR